MLGGILLAVLVPLLLVLRRDLRRSTNRMDTYGGRLDAQGERFDAQGQRLDAQGEKLARIEERLGSIDDALKRKGGSPSAS